MEELMEKEFKKYMSDALDAGLWINNTESAIF
jgi:hypothetical protein